jgi:polysaccharide deacetylase family protein (PEP-CTERM system associated)
VIYPFAPVASVAAPGMPDVHMMSIDVEDYFHVNAFADRISPDQWPSFESRVVSNTSRLLDLFAEHGVHSTFFVLGWVAERYPALIRRIAAEGHELASHSHWHRLVYSLTPASFREDLRRARDVIESATGVRVRGYRAPSYSITRDALWALDVLIEEGYDYDASIFPIRHDVYGIPDAPRVPHRISRESGTILELPGTAARWTSLTVPIGGGYFRLLPYETTRRAIGRYARTQRQPAMFYLHPWEIDAGQPRIGVKLTSRIRHYTNLDSTEARLRRLLTDFRWDTIAAVVLEGERRVAAGMARPASIALPAIAQGTHDHRRV